LIEHLQSERMPISQWFKLQKNVADNDENSRLLDIKIGKTA